MDENDGGILTYRGYIKKLNENQILVFGSNPEGIHGAGLARQAVKLAGAKFGKGRGLVGQSYALVTKNLKENYLEKSTGIVYRKTGYRSVSKELITNNIRELYQTAKDNPTKRFLIGYTRDGECLSGYLSAEMAQMFKAAGPIPLNIIFENKFAELVYQKKIISSENK